MEVSTDTGHQITARRLMHIMLYDNGAVNRLEPDNPSKYPKKNFDAITSACEVYFENHPELLTDHNLEEMAAGEYEKNQAKFGVYPEYAALDKALNEYFDVM